MRADPKKAGNIGHSLIRYQNSLVEHGIEVLDAVALRVILDETSPDPLIAEQELVMAWRVYTQEREDQIAFGKYYFCSSPKEIEAARQFSASWEIVFDPAHVKGVANIKSEITATIEQHLLLDAIKWRAMAANDEKNLKEWGDLWNSKQPRAMDTEQDSKKRKEFAEEKLRWQKYKAARTVWRATSARLERSIQRKLEEHRAYWAQRPTERYDDSALGCIFAFLVSDVNDCCCSLFGAWEKYLENRPFNRRYPSDTCSDEENASDKDRRKLPIKWYDKHPNAREIVESHIRAMVREDIVADIATLERDKRATEERAIAREAYRKAKLQYERDAFLTNVRNMFGQKVVDLISTEDVERYSVGVVKRPKDAEELWYSILAKYDFDQNTSSCLYFIRQGDAIKIGITDDLGRRFAQIKTSAALPCKIENVVYTHHGRMLECKLHDALACYNTHLEWFVLPTEIENALFATKSVDDIENVLIWINVNESEDVPANETDPSPQARPQQGRLF